MQCSPSDQGFSHFFCWGGGGKVIPLPLKAGDEATIILKSTCVLPQKHYLAFAI